MLFNFVPGLFRDLESQVGTAISKEIVLLLAALLVFSSTVAACAREAPASQKEVDGSIKKYQERLEAIDRDTDQWESRLDRLYDFVETKAIEPVRMAKRIA